jgi:hypothetical protein
MKTTAALVFLGLVLGACGADTADQERSETPAGESIAQPMIDAVDDAKAVEGKVIQQKEELDAALEDAEKPADDE